MSDIKRVHPSFSRNKILDIMHGMGLRYKALPRRRKHPTTPKPNQAKIDCVISHIAQGLVDETVEVFYCDEMKFPLFQTSTHSWTCQEDSQRSVYNRREDDRMLTAIVLCSTQRFVAVQVFCKEVTGPDFVFFLNNVVGRLPQTKQYTIIADNASWHHASIVEKTKVSKFLYFNEPRMFQLNMIENAFSFIRAMFRKRPIVDGLVAEAMLIVNLFFDPSNEEKFKGILRNHIRQLMGFYSCREST